MKASSEPTLLGTPADGAEVMLPETRSRWKGNHAAVLSLSGDLEVGLGALILPLNLAGFGPGGRWE